MLRNCCTYPYLFHFVLICFGPGNCLPASLGLIISAAAFGVKFLLLTAACLDGRQADGGGKKVELLSIALTNVVIR